MERGLCGSSDGRARCPRRACRAFAAVPKTPDGEVLVDMVRNALGLDADEGSEEPPTSLVESSR
ncbi:hypothetical protein AKJ09_07346 [Labilithrix luteola]|uniref:Uncharacterized protein n=1 Tax=Labilithrix luteola TaxID=1391654 RepID=A0A0K1Q4M3_9BACT|nr:hypothetical protein AKJ09_07346 [Labilithrix luteola]